MEDLPSIVHASIKPPSTALHGYIYAHTVCVVKLREVGLCEVLLYMSRGPTKAATDTIKSSKVLHGPEGCAVVSLNKSSKITKHMSGYATGKSNPGHKCKAYGYKIPDAYPIV